MTLDLIEFWQTALEGTDLLARRPDFRFDADYYARTYPDIVSAGIDPQVHFQKHGQSEGRAANRYAKVKAERASLDQGLVALVRDPTLAAALEAGQEGVPELLFELVALGHGFDSTYADFSATHYLRMYPDIAKSGMSPFMHYIQFGEFEGRRSLREVRQNLFQGKVDYDPNRETCLIVVHEMSKTGAPIVGLEMVRSAARKYNVVVMALRGGKLLDDFRTSAITVLISETPDEDAEAVIEDQLRAMRFAILNSVETSPFVKLATRQRIPFAMYVHEYTEYTLPAYKSVFSTLFADLLVFSSGPVRHSWGQVMADLEFDIERDSLIVPQAELQPAAVAEADYAASRKRISNLIGRDCTGKRIIFGAGQAHWRKGTDLFVMTAQIARHSDPETLFIWIGDGLNHEDFHFGAWMDKHMRAAGANEPSGNLFFLPPGDYYVDLCQAADAMFLSSRLDPLPNVVFDAMRYGAQVVLFSDASGFDDPLYADCGTLKAVEYGNLKQAAETLLAIPPKPFAAKRSLFKRPAAKSVPTDAFEIIHDTLLARLALHKHFVVGAGDYDVPVLFSDTTPDKDARKSEREKIWSLDRKFVWRSKADAERAISASKNWIHKGVQIARYDRFKGDRVPDFSVHVHAYYIDDLPSDLQRYAAYRQARRIVVTTDTARKAEQIEDIMQRQGLTAETVVVPNQGRDILPFLDLLRREDTAGADDIWCHVHQKKSIGSSTAGDVWRDFLMTILLGDDLAPSSALAAIAQEDCGLVAAFDPYICGWGGSRRLLPFVEGKLPGPLPANPILFPVGNMFWARGSVVRSMNALFGPDYPWPHEPIANDGTVFHLIERLWPAMAVSAGKTAYFIDKPDQKRS